MIGEQILCYLPGKAGLASLVKSVCAAQDVVFTPVAPGQTGERLGVLLGLPMPPQKTAPALPPAGGVLVLHGFSRGRMETLLDALRAAGLGPEVLKAMTTPTNLGWSFAALCAELAREHSELNK